MQLPEGWKRWKNRDFLFKTDTGTYVDVLGEEACDLMKEMAEALEVYEKADSINFHPALGYCAARDVLVKFRSWK